ncbi:Uncharacterised protein [Vibrio cholerae]|nr:Uncharacterised protein [Vibrio cholerae]
MNSLSISLFIKCPSSVECADNVTLQRENCVHYTEMLLRLKSDYQYHLALLSI